VWGLLLLLIFFALVVLFFVWGGGDHAICDRWLQVHILPLVKSCADDKSWRVRSNVAKEFAAVRFLIVCGSAFCVSDLRVYVLCVF
jgi:hypothetical protein